LVSLLNANTFFPVLFLPLWGAFRNERERGGGRRDRGRQRDGFQGFPQALPSINVLHHT
jgi:hypothetical protein